MKVGNPFPTVSIRLPEDVLDNRDDNVFSYWKEGDTCLLQLSRSQPVAQTSAKQYLSGRTMIHSAWEVFELPRKPEGSESAAARMVDIQGNPCIQVYLVWPAFGIHAIVSRQRRLEVCQWVWDFKHQFRYGCVRIRQR